MLIEKDNLSNHQLNVEDLKKQLDLFMEKQKEDFLTNKKSIDILLFERSEHIDSLLTNLWKHFHFDQPNLALLAVGGYGRQELHPLSDIDLLILSTQPLDQEIENKISEFIALLWDLKLVIGHSVRTLDHCLEIGSTDLSVATSLQEARYITGTELLLDQLKNSIFSINFWSSKDFFFAKVQEQTERHARYNNTAYNLEPDIKLTPGGLRDIHTLGWIARRHLGATSLKEMSQYGFLTDAEFRELKECQHFLWRIRFALHLLLRRPDNRLTFAHQQEVAEIFGYQGKNNQAVERMMKDFYRTLGRVTELNKMLIRLFAKEIEDEKEHQSIWILSEDFQQHGKQIEARKPALFQARPDSILEMFLLIADNPSIESISAATLRQLRTARRRLNRHLCELASARSKFIALIRHPNALYKAIPIMHKHGVLAAYLPSWNQIVGQMQFDLFHAYTVDEHTVRLLKHIQCFNNEDNKIKHPLCCEIFPKLAKPELLILAAIFHDIGKGRGGDHSQIGAVEAFEFCQKHNLSKQDSNLVSWLVEEHLLMSVTAQRRDIYDAQVIREFAQKIQNEERLSYLLCLTVADICATNPTLWNSWKRALLAELFQATRDSLRKGNIESFSNVRKRIKENKISAKNKLIHSGFTTQQIDDLWVRFKADYFLRNNPSQLVWHSKQILLHENASQPLVLISNQNTQGGTEIFIYSADRPSLFAHVVDVLDRKNLSVHDAQIMTTKDGFALDTFIVLDLNQEAIDPERHQDISKAISKALISNKEIKQRNRTASTKLKVFNIAPKVNFLATKSKNKTLIELEALDTPSLLAKIGAVFASLNISLQAAKITTIGERAEDFFIVTNSENTALDSKTQEQLKATLLEILTH